jgi:spermidine synthase
MTPLRIALFLFFLLSGFCSLVYQVVWLRLGMASFGVNTAIVSIVLSVFMAGLAGGSWGAGVWLRRSAASPAAALRAYAVAELWIGLSAWIVPIGLAAGGRWLGRLGAGWASADHFTLAGAWLTVVLLPFCVAMGATIPLAMRTVEESQGAGRSLASPGGPGGPGGPGAWKSQKSRRSFSYLYAANVAGAALGTLVSAFVLIELFGFNGTLKFAAGLNFLVAATAAAFSSRSAFRSPVVAEGDLPGGADGTRPLLGALFSTGVVSMAAEVVWVRQFTPFLGTMVYAFAALLAVYLVATFCGSLFYRALDSKTLPKWERRIWIALPVLAVLPLAAADPRLTFGIDGSVFGLFDFDAAARLLAGIAPFSAATGFITPLLVDRYSGGRPRAAGFAYAVNVIGCILGPLLAGFLLLPLVGEQWALALLALLLVASAAVLHRRWLSSAPIAAIAAIAAMAAIPPIAAMTTRGFDSTLPGAAVRRDSTATVTAAGSGMQKRLLVNGVGMTFLTPITKMMAHLPLAFRATPPTRGTLVICLGMGTTLRSALSWNAPATAVELIPSVVDLQPYFHADAHRLFGSPLARIVVDDGRRFLARSTDSYDVIIIDPPPPVYAAGSSLLYSMEFYAAARQRLAPHGILQQWIPAGDGRLKSAAIAAVARNFRHIRLFGGIEGWGIHILASQEPIETLTAEQLAARLPPAAVADLLEWGPAATAAEQFRPVLASETTLEKLKRPRVRALSDDRPVNEYFFLHERRTRSRGAQD